MSETDTVLLHIGYHKTATTWFQTRYLPEHPSLYAPATPEQISQAIVYRDDSEFSIERARSDLLETSSSIDAPVRVLSCERLSGGPFCGGYDANTNAVRLASTFPDAKVWIVVRNQIDLLSSLYRHAVYWDGELQPPRVFFRNDPPALISGLRLHHFRFDRLVSRYQSLFGQGNVLVSAYEDLLNDADSFVARLDDFLGLPSHVLDDRSRINRGLSDEMTLVMRWLNFFTVLDEREEYLLTTGGYPLAQLFERRFVQRLLRYLDRRRGTVPGYGPIHEELSALIGDYYAESNARLESIAGLDLRALDYVTGS